MKRHSKGGTSDTNNQKAGEAYAVQIFRIKKKIGYAQIFAKTSRNHGKKNDPAKQQNVVALNVVK
jgi:hypothetical protein